MADRVRPTSVRTSGSRESSPEQSAVQDAFDAVFESSGEALVVIDSAGAIQRVNARAREVIQLAHPSLPNERLEEVIPGAPEELSRLRSQKLPEPQSLDFALANGLPVRVTLRAILPVSENLLLCIEEGPIVPRTESRWRESDAEIRAVLDSVEPGIVLFASSGSVRLANARFAKMFGFGVRDMEKIATVEELERLLTPRLRVPQALSGRWKSYLQGSTETAHDEVELMRPAGRVLERVSRPVLDPAGHMVGWLELYTEVIGEHQIHSKMLQTEKMAALGQLVSGIAHELNNPLTTIMGYAQLLLGHGLKSAQRSEAEKVYQEAERARHIVKNLLYFARENKPQRTRVDLNEVVKRALALRGYELKLEDIVVECDLAPRLPETMADPYQLQQVVLNLLVNAEQALLEGRGHGHVWIRTRHVVRGRSHKTRDRILLEISDDGPGIPAAVASRIFDPFFTTKPAGVGTGLGLSIVYGIVHQHDGEVTFESQPGAGAKFVVDLPVVPVSLREGHAPPRSGTGLTRTPPTGRVLVIEDEPTVAQLVVDVLREEGYEAEAVLDSGEGLTRLSRSHYDLLICDLRMPRLGGEAIYETLIRTGSPIRNRILFITGDVLAPQSLEFVTQHGLPYLAKPFLVEELKLSVSRMLTSQRDDTTKPEHAAS